MKGKLLDRTRDYGIIYGPHRASFEQDGKYYKGDGTLLDEPVVEEKPPEEPPRAIR